MNIPKPADLLRPLVIALLPACTNFPPPLTPDQAIGLVEHRATLVQAACDRLIKDPASTFSTDTFNQYDPPLTGFSVENVKERCTWIADDNLTDNPALDREIPSVLYRTPDGTTTFSLGDIGRVVEGGGGRVFEVYTFESHPQSTDQPSDPLKDNETASIFSRWDNEASALMCEILTTKEDKVFTEATIHVHDNTLCTRAKQAVRNAIREIQSGLEERERAQ